MAQVPFNLFELTSVLSLGYGAPAAVPNGNGAKANGKPPWLCFCPYIDHSW